MATTLAQESPATVSATRRAPILGHLLALAAFLLAVLPTTAPGSLWTSDEGAMRLQAKLLAEGRGWTLERPFAELDPEGRSVPIADAAVAGDRYAPFAKHPLAAWVAAWFQGLAGDVGPILPSILATVVAAAAAARLAVAVGGPPRLTLWTVGLSGGFFFYSFSVLSHAIGVALAAVSAVGFLGSWTEGPARRWWLAAIGAALLGPFFRTELVLFAVAAGVVSIWVAWSERRPVVAASGLAVAAAGLAGGFLDRWWAASILPGSSPSTTVPGAHPDRVLRGALHAFVAVEHHGSWAWLEEYALVAALVVLAFVVRRDPRRRVALVGAVSAAIAASVWLLLSDPQPVWGLFVAFPTLVFGLVMVGREELRSRPAQVLVGIGVVFAVLVVLTVEPGGGGVQWGGRYLLPGAVVVVPVAVVAAVRRWELLGDVDRVLVAGALVVATGTLAIGGVAVLRQEGADSDAGAATIAALADAAAPRRPVVLSGLQHLGRHAWREVERVDFVLVPAALVGEYAARLGRAGVDELFVVDLAGQGDGRLAGTGFRPLRRLPSRHPGLVVTEFIGAGGASSPSPGPEKDHPISSADRGATSALKGSTSGPTGPAP